MLKDKRFIVGAVMGVGLAGAVGVGVGLSMPRAEAQPSKAELVRTAAAGPVVFAPPPGAPLSFADIIERVSPAVVSIDVKTHVSAESLRRIPGFENFPFEGPQAPGQGGQGGQGGGQGGEAPELPEQYGSGSGFLISPDGYIVTNNHVVENAEEITVKLQDDRELKATVVGRDEGTDLAVIKIEGKNYPYVQFELQAKPRVGDWVIAVGNPLQLGHTATAGIVSAYGRDIGEQYVDYIQIDAPINRGNSGGPTFDIYGRVIGVNTAIYSPTGYSVGIGFAIPADVADAVTKQLIANGKIERGYIGVTIGDLTKDIAESLNMAGTKGAYITETVPGGPSDRAGLKPGDIVLRMNGQAITSSTDLTRQVGRVKAGEVIHLDVLRGGKAQTINIRSGTRPSEAELARLNSNQDEGGQAAPGAQGVVGTAVLGMNVAPLDAANRKRFSIDNSVNGVVVTANPAPRSDAAKKGLKAGDVIVLADNRPVTSVQELQSIVTALKNAKRPSVLLLVNRDRRNVPVPIDLKD
ncbi:Do family serine endopeptidase [Caulobacter sp. 17J80-11]|nr:Do family serine endopeptidase [Caulobacter sp. 17J80-11]MBC6980957.1 Do family serine endopeptidase [Caulobacter sp. 17J80-11]